MLESTLVTMGWAVSNWLIAGVQPEPLGNENMTASPSGAFKTGKGLLNIAANQQEQFEKLCALIHCKELARDPRFVDREVRKARRYELKAEIEQALAKRPAREWAELFNANGVPAGEVLSIPEVLEHPQIAERNLLRRFDASAGTGRAISVVRSGFRLASSDPDPRSPPPALGTDTESILGELGYDSAAVAQLKRDGAV